MITGGPKKEAFNTPKIKPMNFSGNDPFWDLSPMLLDLEKDVRDDKTTTLIIIQQSKAGMRMYWRGTETLITALGLLEYTKQTLWAENCLTKIGE